MAENNRNDEMPLCCDRCLCTLKPGKGNFYEVRIEALADPTPPSFTENDVWQDADGLYEQTIRQMEDLSAQEAMDQGYRRLMLHLCGPCYREWIETPTG